MERITDFFQHVWFMLTQAQKGERFLLQVLLAFAIVDVLLGNWIVAAVEFGVVAGSIFMSYRDLLWFDDHMDDVELEDAIDLLRGNDYVRDIIAGEFVQTMAVNNGNLTPGQDMAHALDMIEAKVVEGR